jgi:hypothetical protein
MFLAFRVQKEKGVRWRGRSSEALLLLHFIACISLISTLFGNLLIYNESVISINSLDLCKFLDDIDFYSINLWL